MRHYLFSGVFFVGSSLLALPCGPSVVEGSAEFTLQSPQILEIVAGDRTVIDWKNFSIGSDETTQIHLPTAQSAVLNRVIEAFPSEIFGKLESNGQVLLINPSGILVGRDAYLDLGSFIASTLDVQNHDFLEGQDLSFSGASKAWVINEGSIHAQESDLILIGQTVENSGTLLAPRGTVALARGSSLLLRVDGTQKIFVSASAEEGSLLNEGIIKAAQAELKAGGTPYGLAFRHSGSIDALGIEERGGEVFLVCEEGQGIVDGSISARDEKGNGGRVEILGQYLKLGGTSEIDVSGLEKGGMLLFEGEHAFIEEGASIFADAWENGSGGTVNVYSEQATSFWGAISARGGALGGNGGSIEISGSNFLEYQGAIDLLAPKGIAGHLLIDPTDVNITGGMQTVGVVFGNPTTLPASSPVTINNGALVGALNSSAGVTITTASAVAGPLGNITITAPISWNHNSFLQLLANNDIVVDASITAMGAFAGDQIILKADSDNTGVGTLTVRIATLGAASLDIQTTNGGGILLQGAQIVLGNTLAAGNTTVQTSAVGGSLALTSSGAMTLVPGSAANNANVLVQSFAPMTITAGSFSMTGGSMNNNFAYVFCNNSPQIFNVAGALSLNGGTGPNLIVGVRKVEISAFLAGCSQTINAGSVSIDAGSGDAAATVIRSEGPQSVIATGAIQITGGSGMNGSSSITCVSAIPTDLQLIQGDSLTMTGGTQVGSTVRIFGNASQQTLTIAGTLSMGGGVATAGPSILQQSSSLPQTITATQLLMISDEGSAVIQNNSAQIITISQDIQVIGNQNPLGSVGSSSIFGATNGTQTVTADSIFIQSGQCPNSAAQIGSFNDQVINCATSITLESIFQPSVGEEADLTYSTNQTIHAGSISVLGNCLIGKKGFLLTPGVEIIDVVGDFILQGFQDAFANIYTASVRPDSADSQQCHVGGNLILEGNGGGTGFQTGSFSTADIDGDLNIFGNNGFASMSGTTNETITVLGAANIDSFAGLGSTAILGTFGPGFIMNVSGDIAIGTSISPGIQSITIDQDYAISSGSTIHIIGGDQIGAQSSISQGVGSPPFFPGQINTRNDLIILGGIGDDASAKIEIFLGFTDIRAGRDLFIVGGDGTNATAHIENFGIIPEMDPISGLFVTPTGLNVAIGRDILVLGGNAVGGNAPAYIASFNGAQTVSAGRNISVQGGGNAADNQALIGSGWVDTTFMPFIPDPPVDLTTSNINAFGSITFQNSSSGSLAFADTLASGIQPSFFVPFVVSNTGSVSVQAAGDVTFSTSVDLFEGPLTIGTHPLAVGADASFAVGQLWIGSSDPFLSGTPVSFTSPAQSPDSIGGFKVDTGPTGGGISFTTTAGFNHLCSGEYFIPGTIFCNLTVGPAAVLNNLTINSVSGDVTIDPFHNITITNPITTAGNILIIAQNDIEITSTGSVAAGQDVNIVVDNRFPVSPFVGPGAFLLDAGGFVTSGAALRIFTARQSQNVILGLLNGLSFTPGSLFVDTSQEQWCTYYFSPFFGGTFTIFYKECLQLLTYQANVIVSENIYSLNGFFDRDDYWTWTEHFRIIDRGEDGFKEPYFLRRSTWPIKAMRIDSFWSGFSPERE